MGKCKNGPHLGSCDATALIVPNQCLSHLLWRIGRVAATCAQGCGNPTRVWIPAKPTAANKKASCSKSLQLGATSSAWLRLASGRRCKEQVEFSEKASALCSPGLVNLTEWRQRACKKAGGNI